MAFALHRIAEHEPQVHLFSSLESIRFQDPLIWQNLYVLHSMYCSYSTESVLLTAVQIASQMADDQLDIIAEFLITVL